MTMPTRRTQIKICGITNLEDARCAAEAGADLLGFVFFPRSPRYVLPAQVAAITQAIRSELGARAPRMVGVFVNDPADSVEAVLGAARLDLAQLHGDELPDEVRQLHPRAFKAIRPQTPNEAEAAMVEYSDTFPSDKTLPQLLLDAYHPEHFGGTGLQANLSVALSLANDCRLLLAGGLAPETVGDAIRAVRPWGVDVSSAVEQAKGIKDHARIRAFVQAVRGKP